MLRFALWLNTTKRIEKLKAQSNSSISIYGLAQDSIVDGPGLRYAVFVQGCPHACPGCHNPESQPFEGGQPYTVDQIVADIRKNPLIHDVTLSGGEPFAQPAACADLAHELKQLGYGVWAYSGYLFEDLVRMDDPEITRFLQNIDVLVDGPFVEKLRSLDLVWKGSSNQRVIDVQASLREGAVTLWKGADASKAQDLPFSKPPSW